MANLFKKHPLAVILSVIFHLALVAFFVFGIDFFKEDIPSKPPVNMVKATVIDYSKEQQKILKEKKRLEDLKKKREKQKVDEAAKLAKLKEQQALDKKKKSDALKKKQLAKEQAAKEQAAKEQAAKKQAAKKQAAREQAAREQAAKEQAAKEQAAKEQAAKEQAAREQEQAERERSLREQTDEEDKQMREQAAVVHEQAVVASFTGQIRQKVEQNWNQPPGDISGLSCDVRVRLIPSGDVIDAQVIKSSGNVLFDRSVELATRKAAPLPLPRDPNMFHHFRELEFNFKPGG